MLRKSQLKFCCINWLIKLFDWLFKYRKKVWSSQASIKLVSSCTELSKTVFPVRKILQNITAFTVCYSGKYHLTQIRVKKNALNYCLIINCSYLVLYLVFISGYHLEWQLRIGNFFIFTELQSMNRKPSMSMW